MTNGIQLPRLFIGSSAEALDVAYAIQENLDFDAETTVWSQALFQPSQSTLHDLLGALDRFDFAAFVFAPHDVIEIQGRVPATVRDNVIFELGLFFGALGLSRCFLVKPRDAEPLHLPTDLLGINPLLYAERRSDRNLIAALGPACNQIRRAFRREAGESKSLQETGQTKFKTLSIHDYRTAWNSPSLRAARQNIREVTLDHYSKEFQSVSKDMRRVFAFLEGLSEAVLDGAVTEGEARATFGEAVVSFWPIAASMLAPPNLRAEYWDPPPRISELYARWSG
jgi:Predicted nucleotide-binding protein containing TIR-like domain